MRADGIVIGWVNEREGLIMVDEMVGVEVEDYVVVCWTDDEMRMADGRAIAGERFRVGWHDWQRVGLNKAAKYGWTVQLVDKKTRLPMHLRSAYFRVESAEDLVLLPVMLLEN
jgi:hypothetical protein